MKDNSFEFPSRDLPNSSRLSPPTQNMPTQHKNRHNDLCYNETPDPAENRMTTTATKSHSSDPQPGSNPPHKQPQGVQREPQRDENSAQPWSDRPLSYPIYKPNSRGNGSVIRFGFNREKACMFVEAATQCGEKQFDWERKIIMKWALSDIGSVLATLQGRTTQTKLFHQSEKANSTFEVIFREDPTRAPYLMSISRQDATDKALRRVLIPVTHAEASVLETALHNAVTGILNW
jgi:hypothetical protein